MHPFELEWGRAVHFWGSQVLHMTKPNDTATTRVSLDFRVIPKELYVDNYVSPLGRSGRADHVLGGSYTDTETERAWRATLSLS
jgi:ectoine hydroxylase-related dioxygenase (phytanoyl-CoA dioxygenase family)